MKLFTSLMLSALVLLSSLSLKAQASAAQALRALQEGALVVKLIVPEKHIEALLKQDRKEEAIKVEEAAEAINNALITAFSSNYTYGQLYFVFTPDIYLLADGDPGVLFDRNGNFATAFPKDWLYIELTESPERGIDGFVVRNRNNDAVLKPFPYFITEWDMFHIKKRSFASMIFDWQKKVKKLEQRLKK